MRQLSAIRKKLWTATWRRLTGSGWRRYVDHVTTRGSLLALSLLVAFHWFHGSYLWWFWEPFGRIMSGEQLSQSRGKEVPSRTGWCCQQRSEQGRRDEWHAMPGSTVPDGPYPRKQGVDGSPRGFLGPRFCDARTPHWRSIAAILSGSIRGPKRRVRNSSESYGKVSEAWPEQLTSSGSPHPFACFT